MGRESRSVTRGWHVSFPEATGSARASPVPIRIHPLRGCGKTVTKGPSRNISLPPLFSAFQSVSFPSKHIPNTGRDPHDWFQPQTELWSHIETITEKDLGSNPP